MRQCLKHMALKMAAFSFLSIAEINMTSLMKNGNHRDYKKNRGNKEDPATCNIIS